MYRSLKSELLTYYGLHDTFAHLAFGLAFYAVAFAATRRPWLSFWLLATGQIINEAIDISEQSSQLVNYRQSIVDTVWTLAVPAGAAAILSAVWAVWIVLRKEDRC
jgi:hypothetical protein